MSLSVVIPAYNNLPQVLTCVNSLQALASIITPQPSEYLIQDDASTDYDGRLVIPRCVASVDRNATNLGFAGNSNAGAARASGNILFLVNQDVQAGTALSEGWDTALLKAFDDPQIGIVGAKLLYENGGIQNAGGIFDGGRAPVHRCLGYSDHTFHEVNTPQEVGWTTGAALAIRRDLFEQLGGFDTSYQGGYFEDVQLCLQVRQLGFKVWYEPRCALVHAVGSTGGNPNFQKNALLFKERWYDKIVPDTPAVMVRYW